MIALGAASIELPLIPAAVARGDERQLGGGRERAAAPLMLHTDVRMARAHVLHMDVRMARAHGCAGAAMRWSGDALERPNR